MDTGHGWRMFAAIVLGVAGVLRFFDAIWAFRYHGALPDDFESALFGGSLATYGWVYLIIAVILVGCAFAVIQGSQAGRWLGIFAAGCLAFSAILWMPFYPVWSLAYIALAVVVMWALAVYGGDEASAREDAGLAELQASEISRQM